MTVTERNELVNAVTEEFRAKQLQILEDLYRLPARELREREKGELISQSLNMVIDAQEILVQALKAKGVKTGYTLWQTIVYHLPQISYAYIDWDSIEKPVEASYIPPQPSRPAAGKTDDPYAAQASAQNNQLLELAIPGGVAVGTILLLTITPLGTALGIIKSLFLVVGTTACGYVVQRLIDSAQKPTQKYASVQIPVERRSAPAAAPAQEVDNETEMIRSARKINLKRFDQWCGEFKRIVLHTLEAENV